MNMDFLEITGKNVAKKNFMIHSSTSSEVENSKCTYESGANLTE